METTKKSTVFTEFIKGIIKENPVFVTLLGMCPTLAVTISASNGLGMGAATLFVLVCSNFVISLLKNFVPKSVRLPCFIVVIASFVTLIEFILKGYFTSLYDSLGLFLSLITVNCIILGRAEAFASKNSPIKSIFDGLGMGLGFTLALVLMGSFREILGAGTWFGMDLHLPLTMSIFISPAGGFFSLGVIIAVISMITKKKPPKNLGCKGCPNAKNCANLTDEERSELS